MTIVSERCAWWEEEFPETITPEHGVLYAKRVFNPASGTPRYLGKVTRCENEQLMRCVPSTTLADRAVYGVFDVVHDEQEHPGDDPWEQDFVIACTGDFLLRVTGPCWAGDSLMSNGDGTAIRVPRDAKLTLSLLEAIFAKASQDYPDVPAGVENPALVPAQLMIG